MRTPTTTDRKLLPTGAAFCLFGLAAPVAFAQSNAGAGTEHGGSALWQLMWVELALVVITLVLLPVLALCCGKGEASEKRGLGLPRGSVRSLLALLVVGSTLNFLLFGAAAFGNDSNQVMSALVALTGSVVGFYFGGRTAAPQPDRETKSEKPAQT